MAIQRYKSAEDVANQLQRIREMGGANDKRVKRAARIASRYINNMYKSQRDRGYKGYGRQAFRLNYAPGEMSKETFAAEFGSTRYSKDVYAKKAAGYSNG